MLANIINSMWDYVWHHWIKPDEKHPRLFAISFVPARTWVRHPVEGYRSYRRTIDGLRAERES